MKKKAEGERFSDIKEEKWRNKGEGVNFPLYFQSGGNGM